LRRLAAGGAPFCESVRSSYDTRFAGFLAVAWILIAILGAIVVTTDPYLSAVQPRQSRSTFHQQITGFRYQQFGEFGPVTRLTADSLSVVPRRFLFFNIKSVNEVHIANARIESHFYAHDTADTALLPAVLDEFTVGGEGGGDEGQYREFGLITRVIVRGVYVELFKADRLALVLRADEGYVDHKNKAPLFISAVLQNPLATVRLMSDRIIWDSQSKVFKIPGQYVSLTEKGKSSGKSAKVDLDFTVSPI
jgi:hypothetical protein